MVESLNSVQLKDGEVFGILSNGVVYDGEVYQGFIVRGMSGVEEDILSNVGMGEMERLNKIIGNCLVGLYKVNRIDFSDQQTFAEDLEDDKKKEGGGHLVSEYEWQVAGSPLEDRTFLAKVVWYMSTVDRLILLLGVRRASLGNEFEFMNKCPSCGYSYRAKVDLSNLEVKLSKVAGQMEYEVAIGDKDIKWHILTARDEEWLSKVEKKIANKKLTLGLLARIDKIGEYEIDRNKPKLAVRHLQSWTLRERNYLRSVFKDYEGDIDTVIENECPACGYEWENELDIGRREFFFPLEIGENG